MAMSLVPMSRQSRGSSYQGKYPPEAFIIPGQDQNGNSTRVWCRVIPMLDRALGTIFDSRKFPFKSRGDIVRWCIKVGVDRLEEMEPVKGSVTAQVDAMIGVLLAEQANFEYMTLFQTLGTTVGMLVQAQALGEARRVVADMRFKISGMDNEYWRGRYLRELEEKFGYLLNNTVRGAGLGDHVNGPDNYMDVDEEEA